MPGRTVSSTAYRYGFNGKENDNDVKGAGNQQDYGMRIYDPRLGRFLSVDPVANQYPELSTYQFATNTPIQAVDLDGLEAWIPNGSKNTKPVLYGPISLEYAKSMGLEMQLRATNVVTNTAQKATVQKVNAAAKWTDNNNLDYQKEVQSAIRKTKANWKAEAQADKPMVSGTFAITSGHIGIGAGAFGSLLGARMDFGSVDLLGKRDGQTMFLGKALDGDNTGKSIRNYRVEAEMLLGGASVERTQIDGILMTPELKRRFLRASITTNAANTGSSIGINVGSVQVGFGLIGIDASLDINLKTRSAAVIIPPPQTGKAVAESTRPNDIHIQVPEK